MVLCFLLFVELANFIRIQCILVKMMLKQICEVLSILINNYMLVGTIFIPLVNFKLFSSTKATKRDILFSYVPNPFSKGGIVFRFLIWHFHGLLW